MIDAYIYDGLRTPFGRHGGALAPVRPDDLLAGVVRTLTNRNPFALTAYEDIVIGNTNQAGEDARNVARHAGLLAGLPESVAGITVNRLCGSGLAAVLDAARAIRCGEGQLLIAGGTESMSRAPFVMAKAEAAYSRDLRIFDSTIGARFPNPRVEAEFGDDSMPETAQNIADALGISRQESDAFAARSQARYEAARQRGFFDKELAAVSVPQGRKQPPLDVTADEHPRPAVVLDKLAGLPSIVEGGIITAGNASGVNDGAAALILGSREAGDAAGVAPRARILAGAVAGVSPRLMGLGPVEACRKVLARAGLTLEQMDVIEINEAFAVVTLLAIQELGLDADKVNVHGGACALGHPIGSSGSRILVTLIHALKQRGLKRGIASLCIGGGEGTAVAIELL